MSGHDRRKVVTAVLPLLFSLAASRAVLGQFSGCYTPWSYRVAINGYSNGQVGVAVLNNRLIVTWGDSSTNQLQAAVYNGQTWTYTSLSNFPQVMGKPSGPAPFGAGGVTMAASPATACNAAYVAWVDATNYRSIWAAKYDGTTWTLNGATPLYTVPDQTPSALPPHTFNPSPPYYPTPPPPNYFWTSAPAIFGNNSSPPPGYSTALPIGFAIPQYLGSAIQPAAPGQGNSYYTYTYGVTLGQSDCNLSTLQLGSYNECLFWNGSQCIDSGYSAYEYDEGFKQGSPQSLTGPWSPLWTGTTGPGGQPYELRALALGNALGNDAPPIWYAIGSPDWFNGATGNLLGCVGWDCLPGNKPLYAGQWTNDGIGGAVNPDDGTAWLVWSCRYFNGDTCNGPQYFSLYHVTTEGTPGTGNQQGSATWCTEDPAKFGSGEAAYAMPAMTFWNHNLWLAWQSSTGQIIVASIAPSNIVWTGQPCVNGQYCTSNSQCCSGLCQGGTCVACLATGWSCTTNSQCCTGNCVEGICSTKCYGVLNGNSPDCL